MEALGGDRQVMLGTHSKSALSTVFITSVHSLSTSFEAVAICVGHTEAVGAVAFSRKTMTFIITGSQDRTIKVWDISKLGESSHSSLPSNLTFRLCLQAKRLQPTTCRN
jgi:U3 small nucleolar RNA-associated protein 13